MSLDKGSSPLFKVNRLEMFTPSTKYPTATSRLVCDWITGNCHLTKLTRRSNPHSAPGKSPDSALCFALCTAEWGGEHHGHISAWPNIHTLQPGGEWHPSPRLLLSLKPWVQQEPCHRAVGVPGSVALQLCFSKLISLATCIRITKCC